MTNKHVSLLAKKMLIGTALSLVLAGPSPAANVNYIKTPDGWITPKHECSANDVVCVDCTFLSDQACYAQADKAGLINHNIGFGPGRAFPATNPLEDRCGGASSTTRSAVVSLTNNSKSGLMGKQGKLICPVAGAISIKTETALAEIASAQSARDEARKLKVRDIIEFHQPYIACTNISDTYEVATASRGSIYKAIEVANQNKFDCDLVNMMTSARRYVAEKREDQPGWAYFCLGFLVNYSNEEDRSRSCQWAYLPDDRRG
jgi:hypothetical protein